MRKLFYFVAFLETFQSYKKRIFTTVLFDDRYEILHNGVDVGKRFNETAEESRPGKVIFVITTDGLENSSREFSYDEVKRMITHQTEKYDWKFVFMGANIDVAKEGSRLGIKAAQSCNIIASSEGMDASLLIFHAHTLIIPKSIFD